MRKNVMFEGRAVSSISVQLKTKWTVEWLTYNSLWDTKQNLDFFSPVDNGELLRNSKQGNNTIILERALGWRSLGRGQLSIQDRSILEIMRT